MPKLFLRTLMVTAVVQFLITRRMAGQAVEEGSAERMWMLYPLNVVVNATAWTLLLAAGGRFLRVFRHA